MHFRSLRFKLTLWYVFILGILLISFSTFLYFTLAKSLHRDVDNKLKSLAELIASEAASPLSKFSFANIDRALETSLNLKPIGKFIQVFDESGKVGRKSDNLKNVQMPISLNALKNASQGIVSFETNRTFGNTPLRVITFPVVEKNHITNIIQIASSLEEVEEALNKLFIILMITVPLALMIASLGGQFLAHKALKPVDEITQTARLITSHNLNQRIHLPKVKDEIARLAETFNEMISRLDQSFRQIKQFSSDASHELKTPLTILKGEVEVTLRRERATQEYQQILRSNLEEINRMSQIVENLLLLSKADSEEISLNKEKINLDEIVNEVLSHMKLIAESKNLRLERSNHHEDIYLSGDGLRIRELLINLIENGIKYTEAGGSICVDVVKNGLPEVRHADANGTVVKEAEYVRITVSDTGIGIAKEDQKRIFDRFFRVDKARSREEGGSGLGLSICKWIIEAHQGEIQVESEVGKGSSFIVKLPLLSP